MSDKADIIDKIRPEKVVELLRRRLMGEVQDSQTGKWAKHPALQKNSLNESGAWDLANLMLAVSNPNTSISKLDDKTIRRRAYEIMNAGVKKMITHMKDYGITNIAQLNYVSEILFSVSFITMKQADNEGIRKMITSIRTENHNITSMDKDTKRSLFKK
jgi:hypothetical protein